jgi:hypothetical protein
MAKGRIDREYDKNLKFVSCDSCENGVVTKLGIECSKKLALSCKPELLEVPKFYRNWESSVAEIS